MLVSIGGCVNSLFENIVNSFMEFSAEVCLFAGYMSTFSSATMIELLRPISPWYRDGTNVTGKFGIQSDSDSECNTLNANIYKTVGSLGTLLDMVSRELKIRVSLVRFRPWAPPIYKSYQ
jgi:hypothetical protein